MSRPFKKRKICKYPTQTKFGPSNRCSEHEIVMTVDEYEAMRLIDFEGHTQQQCAKRMEVGRTTIQAIYASARQKIAHAIVNGLNLSIEGGIYRVCKDRNKSCKQRLCCQKRRERVL